MHSISTTYIPHRKIVKSVCKSLTHAVVGDEYGKKKVEQIEKLDGSVTIIDEDGLFDLIKTSKAPVGYKTPSPKKSKPSLSPNNNVSTSSTSPSPAKSTPSPSPAKSPQKHSASSTPPRKYLIVCLFI